MKRTNQNQNAAPFPARQTKPNARVERLTISIVYPFANDSNNNNDDFKAATPAVTCNDDDDDSADAQ